MRIFSYLFALFLLTPLVGCDSNDDDAASEPQQNIVEIASANSDFETLVTAVVAAELDGTLASSGPFTVFAPVDAAFEALPDGTVASLLEPSNKDQLTAVLTYHVVPGRVPASQVVNLNSATTVQGQDVQISVVNGQVRLNGNVNVIQTDIEASNGIIHVIDGVLLPPQ